MKSKDRLKRVWLTEMVNLFTKSLSISMTLNSSLIQQVQYQCLKTKKLKRKVDFHLLKIQTSPLNLTNQWASKIAWKFYISLNLSNWNKHSMQLKTCCSLISIWFKIKSNQGVKIWMIQPRNKVENTLNMWNKNNKLLSWL